MWKNIICMHEDIGGDCLSLHIVPVLSETCTRVSSSSLGRKRCFRFIENDWGGEQKVDACIQNAANQTLNLGKVINSNEIFSVF